MENALEVELHLHPNEPRRDEARRLEPRVLVVRRRRVVRRKRRLVRSDCIGIEDMVKVYANGKAPACESDVLRQFH